MNTILVLKVTTQDDKIVLLSEHATQNVTPGSEYKIIRNINDKPIKPVIDNSIKCTIETSDTPITELLHKGNKYKIYSIVEFKSFKKPECECVSLIKNNLEYVYRPIFEMILTDFSISKNNNEQRWVMKFTQI